jgi:hypothetical protein
MSDKIIVIKKRDHFHPDAVEEPCLMNGNIDHMIPCPEKEIGFFWGFDTSWQEYWSAAGGADAKIAVPFIDIFDHFRDNGNLANAGAVFGMHDAIVLGMWH